jgi:hypothetical protein
MGGFGSGRRCDAKDTTTSRQQIGIREFGNLPEGAQIGMRWTRGGEPSGSLRVRAGTGGLLLTYFPVDGAQWDQRVHVERVPCRFGGSRPWFVCPGCGAHRESLYMGRFGFTCRCCNSLNYPSTRQPAHDRAAYRAERIRARLGWSPGIENGHGPKPKNMHWRTYERLVAEHDRAARRFDDGVWELLKEKSLRFERGVRSYKR